MKKQKTSFDIKYFIIPLKVYPFDLMVSVDEKDETLFKRLERYGATSEDCEPLMNLSETVSARAVMLPCNLSVIRLKILPKKHDFVSAMVHEVFHIATFVLHRVGMKLKIGTSDESYAYLIGYITKEIYLKLKL